MEDANFSVRYNRIEIASLTAFANRKGDVNKGCKDVCFIRAVGVTQTLATEIEAVDCLLTEQMNRGQGSYLRLGRLPVLADFDEIKFYTQCYEAWVKSDKSRCTLKGDAGNEQFAKITGMMCQKACDKFRESTPNSTETIEKNLAVKLMFWLDCLNGTFMKEWKEGFAYKFIYHGEVKKQEYWFCYLLSLLGIDVMLLLPGGDAPMSLGTLETSVKLVLGKEGSMEIPEYVPQSDRKQEPKRISLWRPDREMVQQTRAKQSQPVSPVPSLEGSRHNRPVIQLPHHPRSQKSGQQTGQIASVLNPRPIQTQGKRELDFEELALLASSIVMISIHDQRGKVVGTGSGIMIGEKGYILTNNHVASGGSFYSVRMEEDEKEYKTEGVIKYHSIFDLALIRIEKQLKPISVYSGSQKLVRGQKVVAIGSPLGLFNSVSNGIISGFRNIDNVDMIQFTAPISHGSSGGAVLNMYGEVIGISTAGMDHGQNINLAVGYECITNFIRGFV